MHYLFITGLFLLLAVTTAHGSTYTVGPGGSDSAPCGQMRQTINAGIACMQGGDELIIEDGIYDEMLGNMAYGYLRAIPHGSSWSAPTRIRARNRHKAVLRVRPPNNLDTNSNILITFEYPSLTSMYVEFDGLTCETELKAYRVYRCIGVVNGQQARFKNFDVNGQIAFVQGSQLIEFHNNDGRNGGYNAAGEDTCYGGSEPEPGFCHAYYFTGSNDLLVDGGTLTHFSGAGVQGYGSSHTVRNVTMRDMKHAGALFMQGCCSTAYNNVMLNTSGGVWVKGGGHKIIQNTMIGRNPTQGLAAIQDNAGGTLVQNNLILNQSGAYMSWEQGFDGANVQGNICDASAQGCKATQAACWVVDASSGNARLCAGSPAHGAGARLGSPYETDHDGVSRSSDWSAGAFAGTNQGGERPETPPTEPAGGTPPAPKNLRILALP